MDGWVVRPRPRLPRVARGAALKIRNPIFDATVINFEGSGLRDHQIRYPREINDFGWIPTLPTYGWQFIVGNSLCTITSRHPDWQFIWLAIHTIKYRIYIIVFYINK